ncbi:MAG: hypothetical protein LQ339_005253 [Xanthoria mediterranea]|nr:MAG: hypothetical protein LQ339_005253 [Xanthoria mediterranea]
MGQRHQLFVVARVRDRYRTLAVVHRQWLFEMGPIERCLRLIHIFEADPNQIPIKQEIRAACNKDDDFWTMATCLLVGSSFEPEIGYQHRVHSLAFNVTLDGIDNNDGITIIDISDTKNIKYCFAFLDGWHRKGLKPQSAGGYLARYEMDPDEDSDEDEDVEEEDESDEDQEQTTCQPKIEADATVLSVLDTRPQDQLEKYRMISKAVLRSWLDPNVEGQYNLDHGEEQGQSVRTKQSLREQTMELLINTLLGDPDHNPDAMAEARQFRHFALKLRNNIFSLAETKELPSSPALVRCLEIAFQGETFVDLSPLTHVSSKILVEAACTLRKSETVRSLDLSHLSQLSGNNLESIVCTASGLETLYILAMRQISFQCVTSLWTKNTTFKNIYHTEVFHHPLNPSPDYSSLLAGLQSPCITDTRNPIKNILFARVLSQKHSGEPNLRKADGITVDWQRSSLSHSPIDDENHMFFSVYPIKDILLPPTKLVNGLANFFRCASIDKTLCNMGEAYLIGSTMAKSFASASPYRMDDATTIMPLPDLLFKACSMAGKLLSALWPVPFPDLHPGELSIVIINETNPSMHTEGSYPSKFRLAVVGPKTADQRDGYIVQSFESYLEGSPQCSSGTQSEEEIATLVQYWKQRMSFVGSCEAAEIDELLPTAAKHMEGMRKSRVWQNTTRMWDQL